MDAGLEYVRQDRRMWKMLSQQISIEKQNEQLEEIGNGSDYLTDMFLGKVVAF